MAVLSELTSGLELDLLSYWNRKSRRGTCPLSKLWNRLIDSVTWWPRVWGHLWGFLRGCQLCLWVRGRWMLWMWAQGDACWGCFRAECACSTSICWAHSRLLGFRPFMPSPPYCVTVGSFRRDSQSIRHTVKVLSSCQVPPHVDPFVLPFLNPCVTPSNPEVLLHFYESLWALILWRIKSCFS